MLSKMLKFGKVIIVTNAQEGWVEYSAFYLLPRVFKVIKEQIPVISAQAEYGHLCEQDRWKELTFKNLWNVEGLIPKTCLLNLIVVGDSEYEINAAKRLKQEIDLKRAPMICLLKLVKFSESIHVEQLESMLIQLNSDFERIAASQSSCLTLMEPSQFA